MYVNTGPHRGQKRVSDTMELELQVVVTLGCWERDLDPLEQQLVLLNYCPNSSF